jgi:hypothetical protein
MTEHTIFLGLYDFEWDAISSIATALATIVALGLPFLIKYLSDRKEAIELRNRQEEVVRAVTDAQKCLLDSLEEIFNNVVGQPIMMERASSRALSRAEVLRVLARGQGLTDGAIASCLSAAQAMDQIASTREPGRRGDRGTLLMHADAALASGTEAGNRLAAFARSASLTINAPTLPSAVAEVSSRK